MIVATGAHRMPHEPDFATELDPRIVQFHSSEYSNPPQLQDGDVLVVGAGNSGAEIGLELASRASSACLAGPKPTGEIPVPHGTSGRGRIGFRVFRFLDHHVVEVSNPIGRKRRPLKHGADPLIRTRKRTSRAAGVELVGRG